ncbi:MAG: hypothetical protein L7S67_06750 [Flavobacteriales bacterium]|nr:hypothetical protein [Flavobacteriales bacterium]
MFVCEPVIVSHVPELLCPVSPALEVLVQCKCKGGKECKLQSSFVNVVYESESRTCAYLAHEMAQITMLSYDKIRRLWNFKVRPTLLTSKVNSLFFFTFEVEGMRVASRLFKVVSRLPRTEVQVIESRKRKLDKIVRTSYAVKQSVTTAERQVTQYVQSPKFRQFMIEACRPYFEGVVRDMIGQRPPKKRFMFSIVNHQSSARQRSRQHMDEINACMQKCKLKDMQSSTATVVTPFVAPPPVVEPLRDAFDESSFLDNLFTDFDAPIL